MVKDHPIVIAGCDSLFEYDLNRAQESAIYEDDWGKQLWLKPLTKDLKDKSLEKHNNLNIFLTGKVSFEYADEIDYMIKNDYAIYPKHITDSYTKNKNRNKTIDFILQNFK